MSGIDTLHDKEGLPDRLIQVDRLRVTGDSSKTAFSELQVESLSPVTQISARFGLLQNVLTVTDDLVSGTNSVEDDKFTCQTGVSAIGLASILTLRQMSTRAGQGTVARFPAIFNIGVTDNNQAAGLITSENLFVFAYLSTAFGILFARDGLDELQELTLTVAASGAETATITIDGIPRIVPLTGNGVLFEDAYEISLFLNANVINYNFSSNGATVIAQAVISGAMGSFDYSSDGVSTGTWDQLIIGADPVTTFIPQSLWNQDTRLIGEPEEILNPQVNNTYQIQLNGSADFYIEDSLTKDQVLVHRISFMNNTPLSNAGNAAFRVGWLNRNVGNTSNVKLQGEYAGTFIEGPIYYDTIPAGVSNSQTIPADPLIKTSVLILRNRLSFAGKINRAEILPYIINAATESSKPVSFALILNPVFSGPVNFQYVNKESSLVEFAIDAVIVTGGLEIGSILVESGSPQSIGFNTTEKTTTAVYPGSMIAIVATHQNGGAGISHASTSYQEDL